MSVVFSAFSRCLPAVTSEVIPPEPTANKNWNPGNYIEGSSASEWSAIKTRLNTVNDPSGDWDGAMMRIGWTEMEGAQGVYTGMDTIQNWLDQIAAFPGKRLIIFIQFKTFGGDAVPAYMRNSATYDDGRSYSGAGNGQYSYASANGGDGGAVPNMHVPAVVTRFNALMAAFASRFNLNPYLEAVVFSEASIASPIGAPDPWPDEDEWYDGMKTGLISARASLSNIQICQWVNAPRDKMRLWVPAIVAVGIGVGMTDLCSEDEGFNYRDDTPGDAGANIGNIQHCQNTNGLAIVMGHASKPAYNGTVVARSQPGGRTIQGEPHVYPIYPGIGGTRQQIRDFAVNTVGCTHIVWIHNTSNHPATGDEDPAAPASAGTYTATSDAYSGNYAGKSFNTVTDNYIHGSNNIGTVTTRPAGWS